MCVGVLASVALGARAADPAAAAAAAGAGAGADAAAQVVGLFMQSCVRFAGDAAGLRDWAAQAGLQPLPAAGQQAFLSGVPGEVFDASTRQDKLVLIAGRAGACSTTAESAGGTEVVKLLEQALRLSHIDFSMTGEDDDKVETALHHREYTASQGDRRWGVLVSTVAGVARGQVMLSTSP